MSFRKVFLENNVPFLFFLILLVGSIGATEKINAWMAENYKKFLELQYFDSQGMFISLIYSAPVLVNCVIILVSITSNITALTFNIELFRSTGSYTREIFWSR